MTPAATAPAPRPPLDDLDHRILARLQIDASVSNLELSGLVHASPPTCLRRVRRLVETGLIERQVDAQRRVCRVRGPGLHAAHDWLETYRRFWEESLDRLAELLEQEENLPPVKAPRRNATPRKSPPRRKP